MRYKVIPIEEEKEKSKIVVLVGIPCSGKSTIAQTWSNVNVVSRDNVRLTLYGKDYNQFKQGEESVTKMFDYLVINYLSEGKNVLLDNCHCKVSYLNDVIKFIDIPLWRALWRNHLRYFKTGKWVPIKVIKKMYENLQKIDRNKYKKYII